MCVYVYKCVYMCIYVHICAYICVYMCIYVQKSEKTITFFIKIDKKVALLLRILVRKCKKRKKVKKPLCFI